MSQTYQLHSQGSLRLTIQARTWGTKQDARGPSRGWSMIRDTLQGKPCLVGHSPFLWYHLSIHIYPLPYIIIIYSHCHPSICYCMSWRDFSEVLNYRGEHAASHFAKPVAVCAGSRDQKCHDSKSSTIWLFNIAMENGPSIDDFPIKASIFCGFSMAMLNSQMVCLHLSIL